jgi:hypothetical protein
MEGSPIWLAVAEELTPEEAAAAPKPVDDGGLKPMSDERWERLNAASGSTMPRGRVITLDQFRKIENKPAGVTSAE